MTAEYVAEILWMAHSLLQRGKRSDFEHLGVGVLGRFGKPAVALDSFYAFALIRKCDEVFAGRDRSEVLRGVDSFTDRIKWSVDGNMFAAYRQAFDAPSGQQALLATAKELLRYMGGDQGFERQMKAVLVIGATFKFADDFLNEANRRMP